MTVIVHALVPAGTGPRPAAQAHAICVVGPVAAITSDGRALGALLTDATATEALADLAQAHHALLARYAGEVPLMPLRLGTVFSGPPALRAALGPGAPAFAAALAEIGCRQEYALRLVPVATPEPPRAPAPDGASFLAAKRARNTARLTRGATRAGVAAALRAGLAGWPVVDTASHPPRADRLADLAVLLGPEDMTAFDALCATVAAQASAADLALQVLGPWPAYSFARAPGATLAGEDGPDARAV